jgi:catechol 2,3-dioxygenase-like lactoylglutathione lyase family enzyme
MIEGISAVTLGTHEMPQAVRFYRALGFEVLHGGEESSFTGLRAGTSYLGRASLDGGRHAPPTRALPAIERQCRPDSADIPTGERALRRELLHLLRDFSQ